MNKELVLLIENDITVNGNKYDDGYLMLKLDNNKNEILNLFNPLRFEKDSMKELVDHIKNGDNVQGLAYKREDDYSYFAILIDNKVMKSVNGMTKHGSKDLYGMYPIKSIEYNREN